MLTIGRSSIDGMWVASKGGAMMTARRTSAAMLAGPRGERAADAQPHHDHRIAEPGGDVDGVVGCANQLRRGESRELARRPCRARRDGEGAGTRTLSPSANSESASSANCRGESVKP